MCVHIYIYIYIYMYIYIYIYWGFQWRYKSPSTFSPFQHFQPWDYKIQLQGTNVYIFAPRIRGKNKPWYEKCSNNDFFHPCSNTASLMYTQTKDIMLHLQVNLTIVFIAFVFNAKSFAIAILVFLFLIFFLLVTFSRQTTKSFLVNVLS